MVIWSRIIRAFSRAWQMDETSEFGFSIWNTRNSVTAWPVAFLWS